MNILRSLVVVSLLAVASTANAQWKFEYHGFVSSSLCIQDQAFANAQCQGLLLAAPTNAAKAPSTNPTPAAGNATASGSFLTGDIRQSRFAFQAMNEGALFAGAQPRGYLEFDLFGPTNTGTLHSGQPLPRIRVAIAELKWGATTLQFGQQNQLIVSQIPDSLSHIANPATYSAGTIAWRLPGVRLNHVMPVGQGLNLTLSAEVTRNNWADSAAANAINSPASISLGEASGLPMTQARALLADSNQAMPWSAYAVIAYHSVNLKGFGDQNAVTAYPNGATDISSFTWQLGGKIAFNSVPLKPTVAANYYSGNGTGNMVGTILQFGDIADVGYWAQIGVTPIPNLNFSLLYGANTPDKADTRLWAGNSARLANTLMGGQLRYTEGGYSLGVEYINYETEWSTGAATSVKNKATQYLLTANYVF